MNAVPTEVHRRLEQIAKMACWQRGATVSAPVATIDLREAPNKKPPPMPNHAMQQLIQRCREVNVRLYIPAPRPGGTGLAWDKLDRDKPLRINSVLLADLEWNHQALINELKRMEGRP